MPIYEYRPTSDDSCSHCREGFERLQKIDDPPAGRCPKCQARVARVVTAPNLASSTPSLQTDNLEKHGFTQYRKLEKGVYEKTAGTGPPIITDKNISDKKS